jgi:hypothetical protein
MYHPLSAPNLRAQVLVGGRISNASDVRLQRPFVWE